jgi:NADPH:quinone reductase-like Zn-dependent oxidoreductase
LIDDPRCSAEFQHVEVPIPSPKKGEVLIRMEATSINAVDWKFQNGIARPFMPRRFPFISGNNMQSHAAGPFSPSCLIDGHFIFDVPTARQDGEVAQTNNHPCLLSGAGFDLAGEVVELGAGVTSFKPGDKVIAINFPVRL